MKKVKKNGKAVLSLWTKLSFLAPFFIIILQSCLFELPDLSEAPKTTPVMTDMEVTEQGEFLVALKISGNYTVDEAELESQILQLLNPVPNGRSIAVEEKTTITGLRKLPVLSQGISNRSSYARSASDTQHSVDIYVFDTENATSGDAGYVLASNDMRVGNILAVVDGASLEDGSSWPFTNRDFVRCNIGWSGRTSAWYLSNFFHFVGNYEPRMEEPNPRSAKPDEARFYQHNVRILPHVR